MRKKKLIWKLQENVIDQNSIHTLINFINSTERYTQFTKVKEFEEVWSQWQGCKYSVFVNSGSSANLIILDSLKDLYRWKRDDEIIVPAVTWITDISSVLQLGLTPIFADVNLDDFSFDYNDLISKITRKTRAIFLSHLVGFPADMKKIKSMVDNKKIAIIEDCCESHGATIDGVKVGNFSDASSFSFYWGHHMTTVEGGMVCTNNEKIYKYALLKRSHGLARELPKKYHSYFKHKHKTIDFNFLFLTTGFNVRNTEIGAALGLAQLQRINQYIKIRNKNYNHFIGLLKKYDKYFVIPHKEGISSFCLPFLLKNSFLKKTLQKFLIRKGIESRPFISGNLLKQPFLKRYSKLDGFPHATFLHNNAFYIGNNQFVDQKRLTLLQLSLEEFFQKYSNE